MSMMKGNRLAQLCWFVVGLALAQMVVASFLPELASGVYGTDARHVAMVAVLVIVLISICGVLAEARASLRQQIEELESKRDVELGLVALREYEMEQRRRDADGQ